MELTPWQSSSFADAAVTNELLSAALSPPISSRFSLYHHHSLFMLVRWRHFRFSGWGLLQSTAVLQQPSVEFQQPTSDFPLVIYSSRKGLKRPYDLHSIHGPKNNKCTSYHDTVNRAIWLALASICIVVNQLDKAKR